MMAGSRFSTGAALAVWTLLISSLMGCAAGYYTRTVWGGARVLATRQAIDRLVDDPRTDADLKRRLLYVRQVRDFASRELALPDNGSYRYYSEVRKGGQRSPYVVWNVVAAPELSVEPREWCYPLIGCAAYRGHFSPQRAARLGRSLEERGLDVNVYGVRAYSTLGRFADPVLSTFLYGQEPIESAGLLFHELAHQVAYLEGDTEFNESFATVVEEEGLDRWLRARGEAQEIERYLTLRARDDEARALILDYREKLAACYERDRSDDWKRAEKARLIAELRRDYERLKAAWGDDRRWDSWFSRDLNNAHFALTGSYRGLAPAFRRLLRDQGNDLSAFYAEVVRIASLGENARKSLLKGTGKGKAPVKGERVQAGS